MVIKSGPYPDWFLDPFRKAGAMNQVLFLDQFNFQKHGGPHWEKHSVMMKADPCATFSQASTQQIASVVYFLSPHIYIILLSFSSYVANILLISVHFVVF